jgi:aspartate kinase
VLHPLSMRPAWEFDIPVRVRNSYNPSALGTLIKADRKNDLPVTSLVEKKAVTLVDIVSTRMLNVHGFMAKVFQVFQDEKISVDVVATSEVSISLTLDPSQFPHPGSHYAKAVKRLQEFSDVTTRSDMSIISIIGNT